MPAEKGAPENPVYRQLVAVLDELSEIDPESLSRTPELGSALSFAPAVPVFDRTVRLFRSLRDCDLSDLPVQLLNQLRDAALRARDMFGQTQGFDPNAEGNPAQKRKQLIDQIAAQYDQQYKLITPVAAYSARKAVDLEELEQAARNSAARLQDLADKQEKRTSEILQQMQARLDDVRVERGKIDVEGHSGDFLDQAEEHLKQTKKWLGWAAGIGAGAVVMSGFALWYYIENVTTMKPAQAVQIGVAKLVLFSILYSAAIWCGRMFKSQWHNYVVNKHRANALSSFERFVDASGDPQTRNAVLLQATRAIFAPQATGFTRSEEIAASPQVVEILRGALGSQGGEG